ncbi:MAG: hypothetical protein IPM56_00290 [Ignavibacteriales bacterium]|nr:MAG: hypothetical protein IPM56_00290 [Ignavibacteriales bacterium]
MMSVVKILSLAILFSTVSFAQSVSLGLKVESLGYLNKNISSNNTEFSTIGLPLSGYIRGCVNLLDDYEIEARAGVQLGETFSGFEYAFTFRYKLLFNIYPQITYLKHNNAGSSGNTGGVHSTDFSFAGIGAEVKFTSVFGMDLNYYIPVGDRELEYSLEYIPATRKVTTNEIGPMIKLGFIFNIGL